MADTAQSHSPNLAFTKAAFAFKDGLNKARAGNKGGNVVVTIKPVEVTTPERKLDTPISAARDAHEKRHKRRIRFLRLVQHLLTSILSISIAILQGRVYVNYNRTKGIPGAWPTHPDLLPTLMLCVTAVAAFIIDIGALVAYFWPQSAIGKKAFQLASSAYGMYTAVKGISYAYSAVVCKTGFNQGTATGNNNDLWSWSCNARNATTSGVTQAGANCTSSTVAWALAIANVSIEVLGAFINQIAKQDAEKFAMSSASVNEKSADMENQASPTDADSDTRPLLSRSADFAGGDTSPAKSQSKPSDDSSAEFDKWTDELDDQLETLKPKIPAPKSG